MVLHRREIIEQWIFKKILYNCIQILFVFGQLYQSASEYMTVQNQIYNHSILLPSMNHLISGFLISIYTSKSKVLNWQFCPVHITNILEAERKEAIKTSNFINEATQPCPYFYVHTLQLDMCVTVRWVGVWSNHCRRLRRPRFWSRVEAFFDAFNALQDFLHVSFVATLYETMSLHIHFYAPLI